MKLAFRSGSKKDVHLAQTLPRATQWAKRPTSKFGNPCVEIGMARRSDSRRTAHSALTRRSANLGDGGTAVGNGHEAIRSCSKPGA
jgi:hypothetical protein